jgi:cytochrome c peroxidase
MKQLCVLVLASLTPACVIGDFNFSDNGAAVTQPDGKTLFESETFGGNGRTCRTCHSKHTGTFSPADAQDRFNKQAVQGPDPLFVGDGTDDGLGNGVSRILAHATVRITIPLPPNISIQEDPTARSVTLLRGTPTTLNTPALDPVLMVDGRAPNLSAQAAGAIRDHAQATVTPTSDQLSAIATFEHGAQFFSSGTLRDYGLHGGAAPALPPGTTDSEIRGRRFFVDQPKQIDPVTGLFKLDGFCAQCHSGPMLNTANGFNANFPKGSRFATARVSQFNVIGNPVYHWVVTNPDGTTTVAASPDPGCVLIPNTCQKQPVALAAKITQGFFKTPSLWDLNKTAPYFHDNSAATLSDVIDEYARMFAAAGGNNPLTDQDKADILAYMALLNLDLLDDAPDDYYGL